MKITGILIYILAAVFVTTYSPYISAEDDSPLDREMAYGTSYSEIGTFDGWSFWVGQGFTFSESYEPVNESHCWAVHLAPEGIYITIQKGMGVYSGVDVNLGTDFFYGITQSPNGDWITRDYFNNLLGRSFSVTNFSISGAPVGPMSGMSAGISSSATFFKNNATGGYARAIQYGSSFSAAYALVSIPIPFSVSLGTESSVEAGFYPLVEWDVYKPGDDPIESIKAGLRQIATSDSTSFCDLNMKEFAIPVLNIIENFPQKVSINEFIQNTEGGSQIDMLIEEVKQWDDSGDTKSLPEKLKPQIPPKEIYTIMKPLQGATAAALETGVKRGYDAKGRDDIIYMNCVKEVHCMRGQKSTITVEAEEIAQAFAGSGLTDFDGVEVVFDVVPDQFMASMGSTQYVFKTLKNGIAEYEFVSDVGTSFLLGVKINPHPKTNNKAVELCRRKIIFDD